MEEPPAAWWSVDAYRAALASRDRQALVCLAGRRCVPPGSCGGECSLDRDWEAGRGLLHALAAARAAEMAAPHSRVTRAAILGALRTGPVGDGWERDEVAACQASLRRG